MKSQTAKIFTPILILAVAAIAAAAIIIGAPKSAAAFEDVQDNAWYADAVTYCNEEGIIQGTGENTFSPDQTMTRAMLATVLYRMSGSPQINTAPAFTDTKAGVWYSDAIAWAAENNLIQGLGGNLFGVDNPVQREQIAAILWRYSDSPIGSETAAFADSAAISDWAVAAINWAGSHKIINGKENNRFDPQGNATRAEVAMILYNYLKQQKDAPDNPPVEKPNKGSSGNSSSGNSSGNSSGGSPERPQPSKPYDGIYPSHEPYGQGIGAMPGRVVWAHNPDSVSWNGSGYWWQPQNFDENIMLDMINDSIASLGGAQTAKEGWNNLFAASKKNRSLTGSYQTGEKIAIKANIKDRKSVV